MPLGRSAAHLLGLAAVLTCTLAGCSGAPPVLGQYPSPMADHTRRHERIAETPFDGLTLQVDDIVPQPIVLYLPAEPDPHVPFRLIVHFHGAGYIPRAALDSLPPRYALAVVNLGAGSSRYEQPFRKADTFLELQETVRRQVAERFGGTLASSETYLTAFSAGYGAVRALVRNDTTYQRLAGVLLLDGLHADYLPSRTVLAEGGRIDAADLAPFLRLARDAVRGDRAFVIAHSEIFPGTFASTTETTDYLLDHLDLPRTPVLTWGPLGMQQLSVARAGSFTVLGFAGNTAPDHVDHLHALYHFIPRILSP